MICLYFARTSHTVASSQRISGIPLGFGLRRACKCNRYSMLRHTTCDAWPIALKHVVSRPVWPAFCSHRSYPECLSYGEIAMKAHSRESGQALLAAAFSLIVLLGAAGLAIDMGYLRYQKRLQQSAADSAALAGAAE